ncbi:unnamed protein product [Acanthoscelides obtectus]|uniref:Uncharacterized protein n=1 Tax=Acanthoscelides obtectus TaxID=200917 RepID=A0A9P0LTG1_ACAOB|nr:unnamed protein product [Acanthoscelides obtectus]CAK1657284.1 hypothetical protein AOBTE_LOCUS20270 [Acanthoscelides obtectus]
MSKKTYTSTFILFVTFSNFHFCSYRVVKNKSQICQLNKPTSIETCQEIVFFFELKKMNYLFFQFIKASQHAAFGQPSYFCMEQKNLVIRIEILAK